MRASSVLDNPGLIAPEILKHRKTILDPDTLILQRGLVSWTMIQQEKGPSTILHLSCEKEQEVHYWTLYSLDLSTKFTNLSHFINIISKYPSLLSHLYLNDPHVGNFTPQIEHNQGAPLISFSPRIIRPQILIFNDFRWHSDWQLSPPTPCTCWTITKYLKISRFIY